MKFVHKANKPLKASVEFFFLPVGHYLAQVGIINMCIDSKQSPKDCFHYAFSS